MNTKYRESLITNTKYLFYMDTLAQKDKAHDFEHHTRVEQIAKYIAKIIKIDTKPSLRS